MLDTSRRVLAAAMIVFAFVGLMPLVPLVFGYYSATVSNDGANTYSLGVAGSANTIISCQLVTTDFDKGGNYTNQKIFQCTNNWNAPATVSVTLQDGNGQLSAFTAGPAVLLNPLETRCVTAATFDTVSQRRTRAVVFRGTASASNLSSTFYFTGNVTTMNTVKEVYCTP